MSLRTLKELIKKNPFLRWQKTALYHRLGKVQALRQTARKYAFPTMGQAWDEIRKQRKSETLFVFGSGASLNTYQLDDWDHIKSHDVLLVNDALLAPIAPTYFLVEAGCKDSLINNIYKKSEVLSQSVILYRADDVFSYFRKQIPRSLKSKVFLYSALVPGYRSEKELCEYYKQLAKHRQQGSWVQQGILADSYGSIIRAVHFGFCLEYKNIVLCGVDLKSGEYFFDSQKKELEKQGLVIPLNSLVNQGAVHNTVDTSIRKVTADMVLYALAEILAPAAAARVFTYRDSSLLYPRIPVYKKET